MSKKYIIKSSNIISLIPILVLTLITTLATVNLRITPTKADVVSTITVTVNPACTLTSSEPSSGTSSLMTNMYYPDIYSVDLTSSCNDVYDSQIFAVGYTGCDDSSAETCTSISNVDENGEPNNTKLLSSTGAFIPGSTPFQTDTSKFTKSGWFMKVTPDSTNNWPFAAQNDFDTFRTIPNTSTLIAKTAITTNQYTNPVSNLNTTYSAYIDGSQTAGSYTGKVKYTLSATPSVYKNYMQYMTLDQCTKTPTTTYDIRDDNEYLVAKLADGNCWMLDNLRLNPANVTLANLKGKTNASDTTLEYLKGSRTGTASNRYATAAVATWTSSYSYSAPLVNIQHADTVMGEGYHFGPGSGKRGVYYNYCAASAGYYCWGNGTSYSDGNTDNSKDEDICPAGWRIPTGGSSGEYQALCIATWGSTCNDGMSMSASNPRSLQVVLSMPLSGWFDDGSFKGVGSYSNFWSSTYNSATNMHNLSVTSSVASLQPTSRRLVGLTVRCVLK